MSENRWESLILINGNQKAQTISSFLCLGNKLGIRVMVIQIPGKIGVLLAIFKAGNFIIVQFGYDFFFYVSISFKRICQIEDALIE